MCFYKIPVKWTYHFLSYDVFHKVIALLGRLVSLSCAWEDESSHSWDFIFGMKNSSFRHEFFFWKYLFFKKETEIQLLKFLLMELFD